MARFGLRSLLDAVLDIPPRANSNGELASGFLRRIKPLASCKDLPSTSAEAQTSMALASFSALCSSGCTPPSSRWDRADICKFSCTLVVTGEFAACIYHRKRRPTTFVSVWRSIFIFSKSEKIRSCQVHSRVGEARGAPPSISLAGKGEQHNTK